MLDTHAVARALTDLTDALRRLVAEQGWVALTAIATVVVAVVAVLDYRRRHRPEVNQRKAQKKALRKVAEEAARRKEKETDALLEAEAKAPDLLTTLQHGLEESPDQRRFRVLREGKFAVMFGPTTTIDHSPANDDGALEGWVAQRAADGLLFRLASAASSPPVYEMLEVLVLYLNGRRLVVRPGADLRVG